jgi:hypothetical protein
MQNFAIEVTARWPKDARQKLLSRVSSCLSRNVFIAFLPLVFWWMVFQFYQFTPPGLRPKINSTFLPWLEQTLFGFQLWQYFTRINTDFLDLLAAAAYAVHFIAPWSFMLWQYFTGRRPLAFLWCLGALNAVAVLTHALFPTAPPWYGAKHGTLKPDYSIRGDPAGLKHADDLLSMNFFYSVYSSSPVVFGSFPSLHAAWPFLMTIFTIADPIGNVAGRVFAVYTATVWWAAMYLAHHFMVDLVGGALYALAVYVASKHYMPDLFGVTPAMATAKSPELDV